MRRYATWRRAARGLASAAHLYLGLVAGLALAIIGVTGSLLVFHDEIDALLDPQLHRVEPRAERAALDDIVAAARASEPAHTPSYVRMPRHEHESIEIWTDGEEGPAIFVDPYTATVLGSQGHGESLTGWLFDLHVELFAGEVGHIIVGITGFALIVLLISGLVLWWPRLRSWTRALFARPRGSLRRINHELHSLTGVWSAAGLFILALTGASLVFHNAFSTALHRITASAPPPPPPESAPRPGASDARLQDAVATARSALPGGRVSWIYLAADESSPLSVRMQMPGEWHPNGRSYVYLDRYTGDLLHAHDALQARTGTRIYDVLYPLHIGRFGLWSRLLYAALGFAPLMLAIGGFYIWWERRRRRHRRVAEQSTVVTRQRAAA